VRQTGILVVVKRKKSLTLNIRQSDPVDLWTSEQEEPGGLSTSVIEKCGASLSGSGQDFGGLNYAMSHEEEHYG
jgi:hypothetical protein